jgi:hypothetical protein
MVKVVDCGRAIGGEASYSGKLSGTTGRDEGPVRGKDTDPAGRPASAGNGLGSLSRRQDHLDAHRSSRKA